MNVLSSWFFSSACNLMSSIALFVYMVRYCIIMLGLYIHCFDLKKELIGQGSLLSYRSMYYQLKYKYRLFVRR